MENYNKLSTCEYEKDFDRICKDIYETKTNDHNLLRLAQNYILSARESKRIKMGEMHDRAILDSMRRILIKADQVDKMVKLDKKSGKYFLVEKNQDNLKKALRRAKKVENEMLYLKSEFIQTKNMTGTENAIKRIVKDITESIK